MAVSVERPRRLFTIEEYDREDVLLVIEVADTSLEYDSTVKLALNARAGIADYWVVDASTQRIHVYHSPSGDRYREQRVLTRRETLEPLAFPGESIAVEAIFA